METIDVNDLLLCAKALAVAAAMAVALFAWLAKWKKSKAKGAVASIALFAFLSMAGCWFADAAMEKSLKRLPKEYMTSDKAKLVLPKI